MIVRLILFANMITKWPRTILKYWGEMNSSRLLEVKESLLKTEENNRYVKKYLLSGIDFSFMITFQG